jgi:hypothetical protein
MRCRDARALLFAVLACGCGHKLSGDPDASMPIDLSSWPDLLRDFDLSMPTVPDGFPTGSNVVPIIVDHGLSPSTITSYNVPFVTIQLCAPGSTTNCQIIDHVSVDTGSVGLRILAAALPPSFLSALPAVQDGSGHDMAECYTFSDGYTWGSVRKGDLAVGGEHASSIAFQLVADPALTVVPQDCKNIGRAEDTLGTFGANGLLGLGSVVADCGSDCETTSNFGFGYNYYGCATPSTCTQVVVPSAQQLQHPASLFATDNNGVLVRLPAVGAGGADSPTGVLVFGIGTQANNALGGATIIGADSAGTFSVELNGQTHTDGFFDSGTSDFTFDDLALPACSGAQWSGWDCPSAPVTFTAQNLDSSNMLHAVTFSVTSAAVLLSGNNNAFDNIAADAGGDKTVFAWGLPFFYGRSVFTAIAGKSTPAGMGPYFAY